MKRAPYCSTELWKEDSRKHDDIIREHGGYQGLQNAEKEVQEMLGGRCNLKTLKSFVASLDIKPPRIAKRRKDLLILWIYDNREQIKNTIAMEANQQTTESPVIFNVDDCLLPEIELFETFQFF